jgi:hypothetical protein
MYAVVGLVRFIYRKRTIEKGLEYCTPMRNGSRIGLSMAGMIRFCYTNAFSKVNTPYAYLLSCVEVKDLDGRCACSRVSSSERRTTGSDPSWFPIIM